MVRVYWSLMCKNDQKCVRLSNIKSHSFLHCNPASPWKRAESKHILVLWSFWMQTLYLEFSWAPTVKLKLFCCPASCIRVGVNAFHPPSNRLAVARSSRRISNQLFRLSCVAFPASARNTTPGPYTKWFRRLAIWSISVGSSREPNFRDHTGKTKTRYPWLGKLYCPCVWWCYACSLCK